MKRALFILLLFSTLTLSAEEGELQFYAGTGGFFPFSLSTNDRTVLIVAALNVPLSLSWGFTDNFSLTLAGAYSYYDNATLKHHKDPEGLTGTLYFNWSRLTTSLQLRYCVYPGYEVSPQVIVGFGQLTEFITDRALYEGDLEKNTYADYARIHLNLEAGFDVSWRIWSILITKAEVLFQYSFTGTFGVSANLYFGVNWFY